MSDDQTDEEDEDKRRRAERRARAQKRLDASKSNAAFREMKRIAEELVLP